MIINAIHIYSIGESPAGFDDWLACLHEAGVTTVVDVRERPEIASNVVFTGDSLREILLKHGVVYYWIGRQLGNGRIPIENSSHSALNKDLQAYADYMQEKAFVRGLKQVTKMAVKHKLALFSGAEQARDCYRGLISDYLLLQGHTTTHLSVNGEKSEHCLHPSARRESVELIYDQEAEGTDAKS